MLSTFAILLFCITANVYADCDGSCGQGEGDCDWNSDCLPGLICEWDWWWGTDYCEAGPDTKNFEWGPWGEFGECEGTCGGMGEKIRHRPCIPPSNGGYECPPPTNPRCNPLTWEAYDNECCSAEEPCGLGEGDCDSDDECAGDMVCGTNNCLQKRRNEKLFTPQADCCELPRVEGQGNPNCLPSGVPAFAEYKSQKNFLLKECCSEEHPCGVGEGDCDNDNECEGDLTCGRNNCDNFPSPKADCCE